MDVPGEGSGTAGGAATVCVRFYGELNRHLPPGQRQRHLARAIGAGHCVGELLGALRVAADAVDLVLVNGQSVDFDRPLRDGDRLSVYPAFQSLDIGPVARLPGRPLRAVRFVADVHLGRLAYYLRLLGFDARYDANAADAELLAVSRDDRRILLSRDRALLDHPALWRGYRVRETAPRRQIGEVLARFDLCRLAAPLTRCLCCNTPLRVLAPAQAAPRLPDDIGYRYDAFWECPGCGRTYWQGSHYRNLKRVPANCWRRPGERLPISRLLRDGL